MYLEIDEGFVTHRKTLRFCALMQSHNAFAFVLRLWSWACRSAPDGDLTGMEAADIEFAIQYTEADGRCCAALIKAGFIEADASGAPARVTGWTDRDNPIRLAIQRVGGAAYGSNWATARALVLMRDGQRCTQPGCGVVDGLDVHHIRPLRLFGDDLEAAHALTNLATLCRPCHAAADAAIRRAERMAGKGTE